MLGFTKQEQGIVLFLIISLALGSAVTVYQRFFRDDTPIRVDSRHLEEFSKRAHEINASDAARIVSSREAVDRSDGRRDKFLIDINTAGPEQLQTIPRIGPALAERIVAHRNQNGVFKSIEELQKVKGIGQATLNRIAPYIKINEIGRRTNPINLTREEKWQKKRVKGR